MLRLWDLLRTGKANRFGVNKITWHTLKGHLRMALNFLLANIMFNELNKELARRGHKFVLHGAMPYKCAAACVRESISISSNRGFTLKWTVTRRKCHTWVGWSTWVTPYRVVKEKCRLRLHPKSVTKMKAKQKELASRSNGWGYAKLKGRLNLYIIGWMNYFKLADMRNVLEQTDKWLCHRIRSYVWKSWKKVGAKSRNLMSVRGW